jgi:hypothetical protein
VPQSSHFSGACCSSEAELCFAHSRSQCGLGSGRETAAARAPDTHAVIPHLQTTAVMAITMAITVAADLKRYACMTAQSALIHIATVVPAVAENRYEPPAIPLSAVAGVNYRIPPADR